MPVHDVTSSTCCNAWPRIRRYTDFNTGVKHVAYARAPKWPHAETATWLVPAADSELATTSTTGKRKAKHGGKYKAKRARQRKAKRRGKLNAASGASAQRLPRSQSMRRFLSVYATCASGCLTICWGFRSTAAVADQRGAASDEAKTSNVLSPKAVARPRLPPNRRTLLPVLLCPVVVTFACLKMCCGPRLRLRLIHSSVSYGKLQQPPATTLKLWCARRGRVRTNQLQRRHHPRCWGRPS